MRRSSCRSKSLAFADLDANQGWGRSGLVQPFAGARLTRRSLGHSSGSATGLSLSDALRALLDCARADGGGLRNPHGLTPCLVPPGVPMPTEDDAKENRGFHESVRRLPKAAQVVHPKSHCRANATRRCLARGIQLISGLGETTQGTRPSTLVHGASGSYAPGVGSSRWREE
jgi:hypothetical protein